MGDRKGMPVSFFTHLAIQRKQILKVALYAIEAFVICLIGTWLFAGAISIGTKLLISGAFALVVFVIGLYGVMLVSTRIVGGSQSGDKKTKIN